MQDLINKFWENRSTLLQDDVKKIEVKHAVMSLLNELNEGSCRVAEKIDGSWLVNQHVKKAILLYFALHNNQLLESGDLKYWDKVPLKFQNYSELDFQNAGFRVVPGAVVRNFCHIQKNVILMPSFVNVGAFIGEGTMVDTWATVGSCAQIGKNCHLSGGVGIGGVLEPLQANPVIIEDGVFIGARSEIVEGVIVGEGAVISMGVYIGASTRIYNRATGEISYGYIPPYSVVVPGVLPSSDGKTQTYAAIIIKQVDEGTRAKTSINNILRENNE